MNKRNLLLIGALAIMGCARATNIGESLTSPDGQLAFAMSQQDGRLTYSITYQGLPVVRDGQLGVNIDNHLVESAMGIPTDTATLWTEHLRLTGIDSLSVDSTWTPLYGENHLIRDRYRQYTYHFEKGTESGSKNGIWDKRQQYLLNIIVRAYDEGIAIRYHFPEATNGLFMHITEDLTSFAFEPGARALHETWAQGPLTWVSLTKEKARDDLEEWKDESERPLYIELSNGLRVAILEAGLHDFTRGKLDLRDDNVLRMSLYDSADIITPYDMPWRVVMVGKRAVDLINHKELLLNLNEPCQIANTDFIKPGKAFRSTRLDDKSIRRSIDFAADFGIDYVELDAGWYGPEMKVASSALSVAPNRDFSMPDLCRYAASKGVSIWLYVNQRALYHQLDSILPLYKKWGVKGLKFGFVQVGGQHWTTWLHDAVKRCARYGLMVDIHDEYRPTGWSRTYPNLLTQEGIGGNEEMPDARHNTIQPFTRFLAGPADYTLCYFADKVKNTKAHQLAMAVVYYSPLQFLFWYDQPDAYQGERELDFWKQCPTIWDESVALDGEPGEYVVQARRSGDTWYVGVMNGLTERDITIDTSAFTDKGQRYAVEIYDDDPTLGTRTNVKTTTLKMKGGKKLNLHLLPSGGAALRLVPAK